MLFSDKTTDYSDLEQLGSKFESVVGPQILAVGDLRLHCSYHVQHARFLVCRRRNCCQSKCTKYIYIYIYIYIYYNLHQPFTILILIGTFGTDYMSQVKILDQVIGRCVTSIV